MARSILAVLLALGVSVPAWAQSQSPNMPPVTVTSAMALPSVPVLQSNTSIMELQALGSGTGMSFKVEGLPIGGSAANWVNLQLWTAPVCAASGLTQSANGDYFVSVAGFSQVRVNVTAFTGGTETFGLTNSAQGNCASNAGPPGSGGGGGGGTSSAFLSSFPSSGTAAGAEYLSAAQTWTNGQMVPLLTDVNGYLKVNVSAGGGAGGTSSSFGSAFPGTGTAVGYSDGTNMRAGTVVNSTGSNYAQLTTPADMVPITTTPGSTANAILFSVDTTGYASVVFTATLASTITSVIIETSNDNTNWFYLPAQRLDNGYLANPITYFGGSTLNWATTGFGRYLRARLSPAGTGTTTISNAFLRPQAFPWIPILNSAGSSTFSGAYTIQGTSGGTAVPVSASSLPLPTGAATSALQTTGNTSLATIATNSATAALDSHLTNVQSAAGTSATTLLTVQGSATGVAVPVSGTVTAGAGSNIIGKVGIDQTTPGTTNGVADYAVNPAGSQTQVHVGTNGGQIPGQVTETQTRTTLTASTITAGPAASARLGITFQVETTLTAPLYICTQGQSGTCSATVYDYQIPSGAAAGTIFVDPFASSGAVYYFSTGTPVVNAVVAAVL